MESPYNLLRKNMRQNKGFITLAKQSYYLAEMDPKILTSLTHYTRSAYESINDALWNDNVNGYVSKVVKNIDRAFMDILPTTESITVYRGTGKLNLNIKSYVSTSIDEMTGLSFVKNKPCCLLRILLPAGSKVLPLWRISASPGELEVLLPRNATFLVTSINTDHKPHIYDLVYIPDVSLAVKQEIQFKNLVNELDDEYWIDLVIKNIDLKKLEEASPEELIGNIENKLHVQIPFSAAKEALDRLSIIY